MTTDQRSRYFLGALAFGFVVTWATLGAEVALLAAGACAAIAYRPSLRRLAPAQRPQTKHRRATRYELVPDEPSLVFGVSELS